VNYGTLSSNAIFRYVTLWNFMEFLVNSKALISFTSFSPYASFPNTPEWQVALSIIVTNSRENHGRKVSWNHLLNNSMSMKNVVFWDVALFRSWVNRRFGGKYRLHLQGRKIREPWTSVSMWLRTVQSPLWKPQIVQFHVHFLTEIIISFWYWATNKFVFGYEISIIWSSMM
jgi:hypothetical protein